MPSERVLIVGAGVAGSILAFWLAKHDFQVTVVERSRAEQKAGQGIEIQEPALQVVKAMGILPQLQAKKTGEKGVVLLDTHSRSYATFDVGPLSLTGDLELMRGDLTEVLYKAADESSNVQYYFETTIQTLTQTENKVHVELESRKTKTTRIEEFDYVIGADGTKSRTRQLIMDVSDNYLKPVGAFVAYFSIPKEDHDWPYSRICQFSGRRIAWTRPIAENSDLTSVYLTCLAKDIPALRQANANGDRAEQKKAFAELYSDGNLGWETSRIIKEMMKAENFYSDELVQVKLPKWSEGRVALVGDSAWAPTPFTGEGNQLAIIGAWVLAQEMSRNRTPAAFERYETRLRSQVEDAQSIPLAGYAPYLFCPKTFLGIWLCRMSFLLLAGIIRLFSWTGLSSMLPNHEAQYFDLEIDGFEVKKDQ